MCTYIHTYIHTYICLISRYIHWIHEDEIIDITSHILAYTQTDTYNSTRRIHQGLMLWFEKYFRQKMIENCVFKTQNTATLWKNIKLFLRKTAIVSPKIGERCRKLWSYVTLTPGWREFVLHNSMPLKKMSICHVRVYLSLKGIKSLSEFFAQSLNSRL
jgi:hypothetical protein